MDGLMACIVKFINYHLRNLLMSLVKVIPRWIGSCFVYKVYCVQRFSSVLNFLQFLNKDFLVGGICTNMPFFFNSQRASLSYSSVHAYSIWTSFDYISFKQYALLFQLSKQKPFTSVKSTSSGLCSYKHAIDLILLSVSTLLSCGESFH